MSSSKLRKISKIVKEITIEKSKTDYDISGLDLSLCKFYYRTPQSLFKDLSLGDYTINKGSNQQTLIIQNSSIISIGEAIQVCYEMDLSSSKYTVDFEVDINRLATSYNELVDDVHTLWEYIRKTGMIADDTTIDLILPQLNNNEVWVKSEDGYKGMPLDDVESSIKDIIDKYSQQKIEEIKREVTTHTNKEIQRATNEITDVKNTSIQNIKDQEKISTNNMINEITQHTEKKKVELNDHEQLKEQELNDLHEQLSTRLQELIDGAVMDKGVLPINSDWHLLDRGNYYVIDLFNSNYKNHPINIVNQNEGQGIVMVGIADDGKTKIIRYYSTSKRMFFQVLTQSNVWSEWAVVGGGNGTVYEIVQNNHGFNFNAVSLDGLTSRWVLADKNTGADAVAIKIDDNRFQLLLNGQGVIPTSSRDDKGNEFIYDEYYFLSNTVNGAFQKDKPTYGLFQPLFHTRMVENKLVADVQIGDIHDLTQHIVDSETIKEYGIATEKDLLNKLDKGAVSSEYDTAEKIEKKIKEIDTKFKNYCPISVGSIDVRYDNKNPAELYPSTTWELLSSDKYIRTGAIPLSTGGSNSINILKENLPNIKLSTEPHIHTQPTHQHDTSIEDQGSHLPTGMLGKNKYNQLYHMGDGYSGVILSSQVTPSGGDNTGSSSPKTEALGSGTPLTIQPAYITLKFWKRLT